MNIVNTSFNLLSLTFVVFYIGFISNLSANQNDLCRDVNADDYSYLLKRVNEIDEANFTVNPDPRSRLLEEYFQACIAPIVAKTNLNDETTIHIKNLFDAVQSIDFYVATKAHEIFLKRAYNELITRDSSYSRLAKYVYRSMIDSRLFDEARRFEPKPPRTFLPEYSEEKRLKDNSQSLIRLTGNASQLIREGYSLPQVSHLVIVAHPNCHFSRNAFTEIDKDPVLSKIIASHSTIIMPVVSSAGLDVTSIHQWNSSDQFQKYPMNYVFSERNWTQIDEWSTPIFYFFDKGKLKGKFVGWPKEGRMKELKTNLRRINLLKNDDG